MHGLVAQQAFLPDPDESYFLSLLSSPVFCLPTEVEQQQQQQPIPFIFPEQHGPPTPPAEIRETKPVSKSKKKAPLPYASNLLNLCFNTPSTEQIAPKKPKKVEKKPRPPKKPVQHPPRYQCDFDGCNKIFTRPYNLKSHKRTHTSERPFGCHYCTKRFARQHDRNRHAKLHTGVKAYVCDHCNKAFARQDALSRHQRPSGQGLCCSNSISNSFTINC